MAASREKSALQEVRTPEASHDRLRELAASEDPEVARVASKRIIRQHIEQGLADLVNGSSPESVALTLLIEAVKLLPGEVAAFGTGQLDEFLGTLWDDDETRDLISAGIRGLLVALLRARGAGAEEIARGLAYGWGGGSIVDLIETSDSVGQPTTE